MIQLMVINFLTLGYKNDILPGVSENVKREGINIQLLDQDINEWEKIKKSKFGFKCSIFIMYLRVSYCYVTPTGILYVLRGFTLA